MVNGVISYRHMPRKRIHSFKEVIEDGHFSANGVKVPYAGEESLLLLYAPGADCSFKLGEWVGLRVGPNLSLSKH